MMVRPWHIRMVAQNQWANLLRLIQRQPVTFPPLGSATLDPDDLNIARSWLSRPTSTWLDDAPVLEFEQAFSSWNNTAYSHAFMGGRVAFSACLSTLDLQPSDEIILPGYTCIVVPNAVRYCGAKVVYCDIELETYGLCAESLKALITPNTKAIVIQHLYGLVSRDLEKLISIAKEHNLVVIEDCAHSTGASFAGTKVGNFGDLAFFSCEQSKILNTTQGGIAITNNERLNAKLIRFKTSAPSVALNRIEALLQNVVLNYYTFKHPLKWLTKDFAFAALNPYLLESTPEDEVQGLMPKHYGATMPAPLASIATNQLGKLDRYNQARRENAQLWEHWGRSNGLPTPSVISDSVPVYLRYPIRVPAPMKQDTSWAEKRLGVQPGVWFKTHVHPSNEPVLNCPNADTAVAQCINMPTLQITKSVNKRIHQNTVNLQLKG